jgi:xylan 1,4-beta-xylosidase
VKNHDKGGKRVGALSMLNLINNKGNHIYFRKIIAQLFDAYIERGMYWIAQIGFMPEALLTHPQPCTFHCEPNNKHGDIFTG